jgi:hypothetical protein
MTQQVWRFDRQLIATSEHQKTRPEWAVTPVPGAVAYAWYVVATTSGAETLQVITTINSVAISAPLAVGRQAATAITGDHSKNDGNNGTPNAFDGLLTTALNAGNNAYVNVLATGTAGTGTALTSTGRGSVNEIDQTVLNGSSAPILRYDQPASASEYGLTASGVIQFYYNPFAMDVPDDVGPVPSFSDRDVCQLAGAEKHHLEGLRVHPCLTCRNTG